MPARNSVLLALVCLGGGCAASGPVRTLAIAANNQAVVDRGFTGMAALRSEQTNVVTVHPLRAKLWHDERAPQPWFSVLVTNGGTQNLILLPNDVAVFSGERRIVLLNPGDLADRLDAAQRKGPNDDANGPAPSRGAAPHRPAGGPGIPTPAEEQRDRFGAPWFKVPAAIVENALRTQTIRPGAVGGGDIVLDASQVQPGFPLKLVVTVAGEKHTFLFDVGN